MKARARAWLDETHGAGFELLRHFFGRFFDFGTGSNPDEWRKVAIGLFAALLSAALVGVRVYIARYGALNSPALSTPQLYRQGVADDILWLTALAMGATALATLIHWSSLFPALEDCLALAGWPVSARQIFVAKACALLLFFAGFVLTLTVLPATLFAAISAGPWQRNPSLATNAAADFAALAGGCAFVFFSLMALQGVLLNLLPGRLFTRISLVTQGVLFIATLGALPLAWRQPTVPWWPPVWFLRLREALTGDPAASSRTAILAIAAPLAISAAAYLLSYHRYRRMLLEAPPEHSAWRPLSRHVQRLLDAWIRTPREQAAFDFIWKTLARSSGHRMLLLAYAGIALGYIVQGLLDMPRASLRDEGLYGMAVTLAPLVVSLLLTLGLRYLFSMPVTLPANWIFQISDQEGRAAWLAAVRRFTIWCGIVPVFVAAFPATAAVLGLPRAVTAIILGLQAALAFFELCFRNWRKLPFTCAYLPGKQPMWLTLLRLLLATALLGPMGALILYCSREPVPFIALSTFQAFAWWRLNAARQKAWAECTLLYDEKPEPAVLTLDLKPPETTGSISPEVPPQAPMFSGLVASRGVLPAAWQEELENERRSPSALLETFLDDLRFGARLIRKSPAFSAVVVLTLTIGIGINASVFTVVNGLALRPHVAREPSSFVRVIAQTRAGYTVRGFSYSEYEALRTQSRSLRQLTAWSMFAAFVGDDDPAGMLGLMVSCDFFAVDGLDHATLGRLFTPEDCRAAGPAPPVILSQSLWRNRFGADPRALGRVIQISNRPVTIVGVVPDRAGGWTFPGSLWLPYTSMTYFDPTRDRFQREDSMWLSLAGRMAPGVSRSQAEAELNILIKRLDQLHPGRLTAIVTTDGSWLEELELTASGRDLMLIAFFFGAFNLVLFIACANVATLLLSRAAARKREIAVRLSLGAPRIRLVRMLVTESLLLAAVAGAVSLYLTWRVPGPLYRMVATRAPDFPMPPDWRIFAYISAVVLATGVISGLAPALESVKVDLASSLKNAGSGSPAKSGNLLRGWLVSAQVAMSMTLLVGAILFAQSEDHSLRANPGYDQGKVVVAPLRFPDGGTIQSAKVRMDAIERRLRSIPGVTGVAFSEEIPLFRPDTVELRPPSRQDASQPVDVYSASPDFFHTLGVPILRGREFREGDVEAAVVSQALVRALWPRQNPIGRTLPLPEGALTVIGVARDVEPLRFGGSENPAAYRLRRPDAESVIMSVRFDAGASSGAPLVRAAVRGVYSDMNSFARLLQQWIDQITEVLWNVVSLILVLGIVATLLATAGIYGSVSFAVNQRTHELGIRVALGARRLDIVREILISGGKPVLRGLLVGLWLSVAAAGGLRESMKGSPLRLNTTDPLIYCAAALLLAAAAVLAMAGPARRGAGSNPLEALRCE